MFALAIGTKYAPELKLDGVVAGAPPSQFAFIYSFLKTSPYRYYLLMAAGGLNTAYGNKVAPLNQVLTPAGLKLIPDLSKGCSDYLSQVMGNLDITKLTKGDPFKIPAWKKVLSANDPESITKASTVPLLMIQGANDEQIPVRVDAAPRHAHVRPRPGSRAVDLSRAEPLGRDRSVVRGHGALDR